MINSVELANYWHLEKFDASNKFILHGYQEIKSISIQLLTLVTAILVVSITFSEKVVKYDEAHKYAKLSLIIGWSALMIAIIFDGIGLALNAFALPHAIFDVNNNEIRKELYSAEFLKHAVRALVSIIISGIFFILGLGFMMTAGVISYKNENIKLEHPQG